MPLATVPVKWGSSVRQAGLLPRGSAGCFCSRKSCFEDSSRFARSRISIFCGTWFSVRTAFSPTFYLEAQAVAHARFEFPVSDRADRTHQAALDAALDYLAVRVSVLSGKTFVVRGCIEKHKITSNIPTYVFLLMPEDTTDIENIARAQKHILNDP